MTAIVPSRRLLHYLFKKTASQALITTAPCQRHRWLTNSASKRRDFVDTSRLEQPSKTQDDEGSMKPNSGKLTRSIFDRPSSTQRRDGQAADDTKNTPREPIEGDLEPEDMKMKPEPKRQALAYYALKPSTAHPNPKAHIRWQRKMVIRDVRGRHRLNRREKLLLTERYHVSKSPFIKTSIKKLGPLARQIAGKPIDEAMIQMRFSKKKAAQDVLKQLKYARDQAIVSKGMGLGRDIAPGVEKPASMKERDRTDKIIVEDKHGKKRIVTDRSAMYVDQAWVGRGTYGRGMDYRARGRGYRLRLPETSISLVLKEEATRVRQQEEREQKRLRKKVWVPLPDRAITAQRQYPLW